MGAFGKSGTEFLRNQLYFNQICCDMGVFLKYGRAHILWAHLGNLVLNFFVTNYISIRLVAMLTRISFTSACIKTTIGLPAPVSRSSFVNEKKSG